MAHLGLARKWRPQTFADLVGQSHISKTISNAIQLDRISQAYLFTGTRGIGKTSTSRIFAKTLRCENPPAPGISCDLCPSCIEIAEGRSVDVLEIDGASNNGVDAVREIRENAKYLPNSGRYKIYIIDEVHMLTTAAFNALLKTLEEPPAHVIFIFATTDPQKIPQTVLSRCQRFDFKRVSQKDLKDRLRFICDAEKVAIDDQALTVIAREAEGSMRDAISLLDQVFSASPDKIDLEAVTSSLGLVDKKIILECTEALLTKKPIQALDCLGKIYLHGFDLKQFGKELLRYLRQVLVASLLDDHGGVSLSVYLDLSDIDLEEVSQLSKTRTSAEIDLMFRVLSHGLEEVSRSSTPKLVMDVLLIKIATGTSLISLKDDQLSRLQFQTNTTQPSSQNISPLPRTEAPSAAVPTNKIPENLYGWWKNTVHVIKAKKPLVGSVLEHFSLEEMRSEPPFMVLTLGYSKDHSFYKDQLQSRAYQDQVQIQFKNILGSAVRLDYKEMQQNKSLAEIESEKKASQLETQKKNILQSEALRATEQLLGAKLERIDISGSGESTL